MAGTNRVLQPGQVLFKTGDQSDGMYLIRRGELCVYLEQDGKEVTLATIGEGGMIGEMALFDNQPRSASVKATKETEVTIISLDDFAKLMKQIPKWFVALMSSLSSRLRQTNERLKKVESGHGGASSGGKGKPFQMVIRMLNLMALAWAKDGEKDGPKDWLLHKAKLEKLMIEVFNEDSAKVTKLFEVLLGQKILTQRLDSYKAVVFSLPNRGSLASLAAFLAERVKADPARPAFGDSALEMLKTLEALAMATPYDTPTVTAQDLLKEGKRTGKNTASWDRDIDLLKNAGDEVKVVKLSGGLGIKVNKKDIAAWVRNHELAAVLYKSNLV